MTMLHPYIKFGILQYPAMGKYLKQQEYIIKYSINKRLYTNN